MLEELSSGISRFVMGGLGDLEDAFHSIKMENPGLSFPECVDLFQKEHNAQLNNIQLNHGMKGFERAVKDLG